MKLVFIGLKSLFGSVEGTKQLLSGLVSSCGIRMSSLPCSFGKSDFRSNKYYFSSTCLSSHHATQSNNTNYRRLLVVAIPGGARMHVI